MAGTSYPSNYFLWLWSGTISRAGSLRESSQLMMWETFFTAGKMTARALLLKFLPVLLRNSVSKYSDGADLQSCK